MISSSALLLVAASLVLLFLSNKGISAWLRSRHDAVREHLYGPEELHAADAASPVSPDSELLPQEEPAVEDDFDYSIFATEPSPHQ